MTDVIAAPGALTEPVAPTVDTLTWEEAVTLGSQAWENAEQSKWDIGDVGAIVAHKWQTDSLRKFANEIGMHDAPRRLYEYVAVAQHYPKSARAQYPKVTWSAWRECSRHGLTPEQSLAAIAEHGEKPVAAIRRALTGDNEPHTERREFEVNAKRFMWNVEAIGVADEDKLIQTMNDHPNATVTIVVTWTA